MEGTFFTIELCVYHDIGQYTMPVACPSVTLLYECIALFTRIINELNKDAYNNIGRIVFWIIQWFMWTSWCGLNQVYEIPLLTWCKLNLQWYYIVLVNILRPRRMATILMATFSNTFSLVKIMAFWFAFHRIFFLKVQLTTHQHWCR